MRDRELTIVWLWQDVPSVKLPSFTDEASWANQLIILAVTILGLTLREWSAQRQAKRVRDETVQAAARLSMKVDHERQSVELAVKAAVETARQDAEYQAEFVRTTVRHDVRNELQQAQLRVIELQRALATKLDVNTREVRAARNEANHTDEKITELREQFNALLGQSTATTERVEQKLDDDHSLEVDTNERVQRIEDHTIGSGDDKA